MKSKSENISAAGSFLPLVLVVVNWLQRHLIRLCCLVFLDVLLRELHLHLS